MLNKRNKIKILITAKMGYGTFEAKLNPLIKMDEVEKIFVVRKEIGPELDKVIYFVLPTLCKNGFINLLFTPFYLTYKSIMLKPDIIISYHFIPYAIFAYIAGKLTRTPYIVSQTGLIIHEQVKKPFYKLIFKAVTNNSLYVHVPGSFSKTKWIEFGVNTDKINILHSTIDIERFYPTNAKKEYDFIFVGVFYEVKRINFIIDAFDRLYKQDNKLKMLLVGDGNLMFEMKKKVEALGLSKNIEFTGFRKDTENYLNVSKVFLMASKTEGLPCALMEAMACELTVVVPNVGNISDVVIDSSNGYLINEPSVGKLSAYMLKAISNYNNDSQLRKIARDTVVNKHSYQSAIKLWQKVLFSESEN